MKYLSIKNFAKHQHYKDRRPPWIKLHAEVLDDYAFGCLQDASKAHLMLLWVVASKLDNRIPYDLPWITKQIGATSPVDLEELVLQGFIEVGQDDGKTLAPRKQSAMPETETEERQSKRKKKRTDSGESGLSLSVGWPYEAFTLWSEKVAPLQEVGRISGPIKAAVHKHGWPKVKDGLEAYIAGTVEGRWNLQAFVNNANYWVKIGQETPRMASGEFSTVNPDGSWNELGRIVNANAKKTA